MSRAVRDTGRHVLLVARWRHLHAGAAALGAAAATATSAPTMCRPAEGGRARALDTCAQQLLPSFLLGAAIVACAKHNASRQLAATFSSVLDQHGGCGYEYPKLQLTPGHRSVRFCRLQKWYGEGGTGTGFHALASRRPAQPNDGASGTSSDRTARPQADAVPTTAFSYKVVGGGMVEYRGEVRSAGSEIPHGRGVQVFPDGAVYSGEFVDGKHEGTGRLSKASGDVYDGKWKNGQPHGHGVETYLTGERYEGYWKNGRKVGRGRFKHTDGLEQQVIVGKDGRLSVM